MVRTFQRHPAMSSLALGFVLLVAGSSVNASLGGVMVVGEGVIIIVCVSLTAKGVALLAIAPAGSLRARL